MLQPGGARIQNILERYVSRGFPIQGMVLFRPGSRKLPRALAYPLEKEKGSCLVYVPMSPSKGASYVLNDVRDAVDQVVVVEFAVVPTLELVERPMGGIVGDPVLKLAKAPDELLDADLAGRLPKELVVEVLDPLLVCM